MRSFTPWRAVRLNRRRRCVRLGLWPRAIDRIDESNDRMISRSRRGGVSGSRFHCQDAGADGRDQISGTAPRPPGRGRRRACLHGRPGRNSLADARSHWNDAGLVVERAESDSGNFFIPCIVEGHGELMLSTASLMERDAAVSARKSNWPAARSTACATKSPSGSRWACIVAATATRAMAAAHEHLSWAVTRQDDPEAAADRALVAVHAGARRDRAVERRLRRTGAGGPPSAGRQAQHAVGRQSGPCSTVRGDRSANRRRPSTRPWCRSCGARSKPAEGKRDWTVSDEQIEWCRAQGLKICSGPLLADRQMVAARLDVPVGRRRRREFSLLRGRAHSGRGRAAIAARCSSGNAPRG